MLQPSNHTHPSIAKFQQFVELKDYRPPTRKEYVRYVRKLAEHFGCDPLSLSEDQVRQYFLFLRQEKHYTRSPMKAAKFSLRSFFVDCHQRTGWTVFAEVRIAEPLILPVVLSRQEVAAVLGAVREPRLRVCLELIYHCGLRVGEAVRVEVRDLHESRSQQPRLHVRCGKGGGDRFVPMSPGMVQRLRQWWRQHQHPVWLFPGPGIGWRERGHTALEAAAKATTHLSVSAVQNTFRLARAQSGINAAATPHTLRHSYATHLLEEGVSLLQISRYLGHRVKGFASRGRPLNICPKPACFTFTFCNPNRTTDSTSGFRPTCAAGCGSIREGKPSLLPHVAPGA